MSRLGNRRNTGASAGLAKASGKAVGACFVVRFFTICVFHGSWVHPKKSDASVCWMFITAKRKSCKHYFSIKAAK